MPASPTNRRTLCLRPPAGPQLALDLPRALAPAAQAHFGAWADASPAADDAPTLRVNTAAVDDHTTFTLWAENSVFTVVESVPEAVLSLQSWVDDQVALLASGVTPVHAGAVSWRGEGILLPGPSGAGKSRLVATLVQDGAEYLSDELALIDDEGHIAPYPRPVILRDESGRRQAVAPAVLGATARTRVPVRVILALRFEPGGAWSLRPLAGSEAALLLVANSPRPLAPGRELPRGILAAAGAVAFQGARGDARETSARVRELCDALTSR